jgi:hypothetical protein
MSRTAQIQQGSATALFLILLAVAAAFVGMSGRLLPVVVASHFDAAGVANGFMPRAFYVRFMLVFVVALPAALVLLPSLAFGHPKARINLPHRKYWLAPERRAESIGFLRRHAARFGSLLVVFLCYVHGLVLRANANVPPNLEAAWFVGGLVFLLLAMIVWTAALMRRFRKLPE